MLHFQVHVIILTVALHQFSRFKSFGLQWSFSVSVDLKSGRKQYREARKRFNEFWKGYCECHVWSQSCSVKEEIKKKMCWQHWKYSKQRRSASVYSEMSSVSACGWDYYCILCLCYFSVETRLYWLFCNLLHIYVVQAFCFLPNCCLSIRACFI